MNTDNNIISFFAAGAPKGQPRPRAFARKFGNKFVARVFDAGTAEGWKSCVAMAAKSHTPDTLFEGPVNAALAFYFSRPKSHFRTGKNAHLLRDDAPAYHTSKPDADNLAKAVLDAMTQMGGWWRDDQQVAGLTVVKWWAGANAPAGVSVIINRMR